MSGRRKAVAARLREAGLAVEPIADPTPYSASITFGGLTAEDRFGTAGEAVEFIYHALPDPEEISDRDAGIDIRITKGNIVVARVFYIGGHAAFDDSETDAIASQFDAL